MAFQFRHCIYKLPKMGGLQTRKMTYGMMLICLTMSIAILGCQAKDYSERIGPYEVNFTISDDQISNTKVNKTISSDEALDGTPYYSYRIDLLYTDIKPEQGWGYLEILHSNETRVEDLNSIAQSTLGFGEGHGCACLLVEKLIDGHDGIIINCHWCDLGNYYVFEYLLDNQTIVNGAIWQDWYTGSLPLYMEMLPFLESIHVKRVE